MPVRTEASPIAIPIAIVDRRLQATRAAAMTGRTISAAISRIPTTRIESAIVTAASAAVSALSGATGRPATRAPSSSTTTATSGRYSSAISVSAPAPSAAITTRSERVTVRIDPKRNWNRLTFSAPAAETSTTPPAMPV
jgi:hypothetical protein